MRHTRLMKSILKIIDSTRNSLFVQGYDEENRVVKNRSALFKAARMGNQDARGILRRVAEIHAQLIAENDPNKQLSLCKDLTKDGLFLFLSEGEQKKFIWRLYDLAKDDIGAREVFLGLSNDIAKMTVGVQKEFIGALYWLAKENEDARKVFFGLESQKESMTEDAWEYYEEMLEELKRLEELKKENN